MPWEADGEFIRLYSWNADAAAGFDIMSDRIDNDTDDIAAGIARCRNLDGLNQPATNLPMAGFRHTGVGAATGNDQYARLDQVMPASGGSFTGPVTFTSITASGATITGTLTASGPANFSGGSQVTGGLTVDNENLTGNLRVSGQSNLTGAVTLAGGLDISGTYPSTSYALYVNGQVYSGTQYIAGNQTVSGSLTSAVATIGGAVTLNNTGISANYLAVTGNASVAGAITVTGSSSIGGLAVGSGGLSSGGVADFYGNIMVYAALVAPSGGGGLPVYNGMVIHPDSGQSVALETFAGIECQGVCDATGGFTVGGVPHMMTGRFGSLFHALDEAPDGVSFVITKSAGEFTARVIGLADPDAQGRRSLFIQETA